MSGVTWCYRELPRYYQARLSGQNFLPLALGYNRRSFAGVMMGPATATDVFSKAKRSEVMARIRGTGNKDTELRLMAIFRAAGIKGWRRGSKLVGKPDFVFPKLKVAVFVDGCFWHGCPKHGTWPKNRAAFWLAKITGNKARDRKVKRLLRAKGWTVLRIWEHELTRKNTERFLKRLGRVPALGEFKT